MAGVWGLVGFVESHAGVSLLPGACELPEKSKYIVFFIYFFFRIFEEVVLCIRTEKW